jgi:hypothetical protein
MNYAWYHILEGIGEACLSSNSDKKTFLTKVLCVLVERSWRTILNTSMIYQRLSCIWWHTREICFFSLFGVSLDGVGKNFTFWKEDTFLIIFHPIWCVIGFLSQINQILENWKKQQRQRCQKKNFVGVYKEKTQWTYSVSSFWWKWRGNYVGISDMLNYWWRFRW